MWLGRGALLHTGTQASRDPVSFHLGRLRWNGGQWLHHCLQPRNPQLFFFSTFQPVNKQGKRESMGDWANSFEKPLTNHCHSYSISHMAIPNCKSAWKMWSVHTRRKPLSNNFVSYRVGIQCVGHNRPKKKKKVNHFNCIASITSKVGIVFHFY